jgi:hypothetical protein
MASNLIPIIILSVALIAFVIWIVIAGNKGAKKHG